MYEVSHFKESKIYQVNEICCITDMKESKLFYVKNIKCLIFKSSFSREKFKKCINKEEFKKCINKEERELSYNIQHILKKWR